MAYLGGLFTISQCSIPPFPTVLSLFLVCIDVKWGDAVLFSVFDLAFILILFLYLIICMIV